MELPHIHLAVKQSSGSCLVAANIVQPCSLAALQTFQSCFLPEGQITGIIMDVANVTKEYIRLGLLTKKTISYFLQ